VQVRIDTPPELVYERIADVTAVGRQSSECRSSAWLPGHPPGQVGARFRGHNRFRLARWSRVCEVVEADAGRRFAFRTVPERIDLSRADSTVWSFTIEPDGAGSLVTHAYRIEKLPVQPFRWLYGKLLPHHRDMRPHMQHTLDSLRTELESGSTQPPLPA
jgi:hypothetical protein